MFRMLGLFKCKKRVTFSVLIIYKHSLRYFDENVNTKALVRHTSILFRSGKGRYFPRCLVVYFIVKNKTFSVVIEGWHLSSLVTVVCLTIYLAVFYNGKFPNRHSIFKRAKKLSRLISKTFLENINNL